MVKVVGVRFRKASKIYFFDPGELEMTNSDAVIVETVRGVELGYVVSPVRELPEEQVVQPLKAVLRMATDQDLSQAEHNAASEKTAYGICQDRIAAHKLEMKLVDVEYAFDGSKIIFFFTANGRVDFRALVKNLASIFKTRIELRQIGVRDEAKMLGGLGSCGRPICCGTFLGEFQPVSIKMAKEQNLSLNPTKISGLCGRLMCCLKYEQEHYERVRKSVPKVGKEIVTPDGVGTLVEINAIKETVRVRRYNGETAEYVEYPIDQVCRPEKPQPPAPKQKIVPDQEEDLELLEDIEMATEDLQLDPADALALEGAEEEH